MPAELTVYTHAGWPKYPNRCVAPERGVVYRRWETDGAPGRGGTPAFDFAQAAQMKN